MTDRTAQEAGTFGIPWRESYGEAGDMAYGMMLRYAGCVARTWKPWDGRPRCGHVMGGANWYGAECTNATLLFAAVLRYGRYDGAVTGIGGEDLADRAVSVIRYICFTHDSGPADCVRVRSRNLHCAGTKWGEKGQGFFRQSQCGRSVFALGLGAWLLWDRLDAETRLLVQAVVEDYEERFCEDTPRNGTYFDTQCEENGWTSNGLSIGPFLFPDHPRAKVWEEGYRRWTLNTAVLPADRRNDPAVSGPLAEGRRFLVNTLHPDYTAENHSFVHPDYLNASFILRAPAAILALATGKPIPPEIFFHAEDIYDRVMKPWVLKDGGSLYPQGQDWWYTKLSEFQFTHTVMNVLFGREDAAAFELANLKTCAALQDPSGSIYPSRWADYPVAPRDFEFVEDMAIFCSPLTVFSFMLHAHAPKPEVRPGNMGELLRSMTGTHMYPHGGLAVHRKERSVTAFSFRNHVTACTLPEDGYWVITPTYVNYVGVIDGDRTAESQVYSKPVCDALDYTARDYGDGLGVRVRIGRLSGAVRQDAAFVSLPDGDMVYMERVSALRDASAGTYETGIVGVRNEAEPTLGDLAKGRRILSMEGGVERRYEGRFGGNDRIEAFPAPGYLAIDDRMAFLLHGSRGVKYVNIHEYPKWRGLEDLLFLNSAPGPYALRAGQAEKPLVVVSMPNCGIAEAARRSAFFAVPDCAPAGCLLVLHGDHLAYANFGGARLSATARATIRGDLLLFRGRTSVGDGSFRWQGDLAAGEAGYLPALWTVSGACDGLTAELSGSSGGFLCNGSKRPLSFRIRRAGTGTWKDVGLPAGGFQGLE